MMKITGLSHLFKWENLHNWWLTKYFFAPLYLAPKLWNSFPDNIRGSDTLSLFKSRLKTHLFSQAFI